jgi:hypothetical protein
MVVNQIAFGFLSVPDLQPVPCAQDAMDAMDIESMPPMGSSSSNSDKAEKLTQDAYVPVNYISPEAYAFLIAAEASAARRSNEIATAHVGLDLNVIGLTSHAPSAAHGWYPHVLSSTAPPKRYYTTFWQSISLRLLEQSSHMLC